MMTRMDGVLLPASLRSYQGRATIHGDCRRMLGEELALKQAIVSNITYGGQLQDFEAMMEVFIG